MSLHWPLPRSIKFRKPFRSWISFKNVPDQSRDQHVSALSRTSGANNSNINAESDHMEILALPRTSGAINSNINAEPDHMEIPANPRTSGAITVCKLTDTVKYVPFLIMHIFKLLKCVHCRFWEKSTDFKRNPVISGRQVFFSDCNFTLFCEIDFMPEIVDFSLNWRQSDFKGLWGPNGANQDGNVNI